MARHRSSSSPSADPPAGAPHVQGTAKRLWSDRRSLQDFLEPPASVRHAIRAIMGATVLATIAGGILARVFDPDDFPTLGTALWWSLQTVTTVGYGDVTPTSGIGRAIGAVILIYSVAFMSLLTAAITTSFMDHARRQRRAEEHDDLTAVLRRLDEIADRLDQLEQRSPVDDRPRDQQS